MERKFHGTLAPGSESSWERKFHNSLFFTDCRSCCYCTFLEIAHKQLDGVTTLNALPLESPQCCSFIHQMAPLCIVRTACDTVTRSRPRPTRRRSAKKFATKVVQIGVIRWGKHRRLGESRFFGMNETLLSRYFAEILSADKRKNYGRTMLSGVEKTPNFFAPLLAFNVLRGG